MLILVKVLSAPRFFMAFHGKKRARKETQDIKK